MPPEGETKSLQEAEIASVNNWINGTIVVPSTSDYMKIESPMTGKTIGLVALSAEADVHNAVAAAAAAFPAWSALTIKARAAIMLRFHALVQRHASELAELIVLENGKNITEGMGVLYTFTVSDHGR
jgi:malonate-semialdehyde dehydrogenase (acetylating)/methylmalonate-semialdehyde dehydrogenase